jgi:hypothetical protein
MLLLQSMWDHNQTLCIVPSKDKDEHEILLSDGTSHALTWKWNLDMDKEKQKTSDSYSGDDEKSSLLGYDTMFQKSWLPPSSW